MKKLAKIFIFIYNTSLSLASSCTQYALEKCNKINCQIENLKLPCPPEEQEHLISSCRCCNSCKRSLGETCGWDGSCKTGLKCLDVLDCNNQPTVLKKCGYNDTGLFREPCKNICNSPKPEETPCTKYDCFNGHWYATLQTCSTDKNDCRNGERYLREPDECCGTCQVIREVPFEQPVVLIENLPKIIGPTTVPSFIEPEDRYKYLAILLGSCLVFVVACTPLVYCFYRFRKHKHHETYSFGDTPAVEYDPFDVLSKIKYLGRQIWKFF